MTSALNHRQQSNGSNFSLNNTKRFSNGEPLFFAKYPMYKIYTFSFLLVSLFSLSAQEKITFPCDLAPYLNQEVTITNPMVVISNSSLENYGQLTLSSHRQRIPTEVELPASSGYLNTLRRNQEERLELAKSSRFSYTDEIGSRRTGSVIPELTGTILFQYGKYFIHPTQPVYFENSDRTDAPKAMSGINLKVVSANLCHYIADSLMWSEGNGAKNQPEFNRQREKIIRALLAMDAGIYALCEVGEGEKALQDLVSGMNRFIGSDDYEYVFDGDVKATRYTKSGFIYHRRLVRPYGTFQFNEIAELAYLNKRKIAIGFELLSNGERLVVNMNHFISKSSGSGENADQNDGQGKSNATRIREAKATLSFLKKLQYEFNDKDVLVVGDLNAYSQEDPIRILEAGGLVNEVEKYVPQGYSYTYQGQVGYIDHVFTTSSLSAQVAEVQPWSVNADEVAAIGYKNAEKCLPDKPYRYSDHDPLLTGINLGTSGIAVEEAENELVITGSAAQGYLSIHCKGVRFMTVLDLTGKVVYYEHMNGAPDHVLLPTDAISSGYYLIRVGTDERCLSAKIRIAR